MKWKWDCWFCQEADFLSWVRVKKGSCDNPFLGLVSCIRDIAKKDLENRFPGLNTVLYAQTKGKVVNPASFRPLSWLAKHFGRKLTTQLRPGGQQPFSLCKSFELNGWPRVSSGTVSYVKFAKALGCLLSEDTPPEETLRLSHCDWVGILFVAFPMMTNILNVNLSVDEDL